MISLQWETIETHHMPRHFRVRINISEDTDSDNVILLNDIQKIDSNLLLYSKNVGKRDDYSLKKIFKLAAYRSSNENSYKYPSNGVSFCDKGTSKDPIEHNQSYEYCILTCNPYIMNPAVNTFFYTTKPEKVYIPQSSIEKVMVNGEEKSYLKVIWYTAKNDGIYWPYNFLILRKETNDDIPKRIAPLQLDINLGQLELNNEEKQIFEIGKQGIRLRQTQTRPVMFEKVFDLGKMNDWKVTFNPFSMNEMGDNNNKTLYINDVEFNWTDTNRSYSFNGRQLKIRIELGKNEMLRQFKITETIILEDNIENIDRLYNEETSLVNKEKEIKLKLNDKIMKKNEKIIKYTKIIEDKNRFSLEDDYEPDQAL